MESANLSGAADNSSQNTPRIFGADLSGADLRNANLKNAILVRVKFDYADLRGADLRGSNMTRVSLQGTKYDVDAFDNVINV